MGNHHDVNRNKQAISTSGAMVHAYLYESTHELDQMIVAYCPNVWLIISSIAFLFC